MTAPPLPSAPAAPPENIPVTEKSHADEVPNIVNGSFKARARQIENRVKKEGGTIKKLTEGSLENDIVSLHILNDLAKSDDKTFETPIKQGYDKDGKPTGVELKVVKDGELWRVASPDEIKTGHGVSTVTQIAGKKGGAFICTLDSGQGAPVEISSEVVLDAQMAGIYEYDKSQTKGVISEAEKKVIGAYLESRYSGKPDALSKLDNATLLEVAKANGLPITESLIIFLNKQKVTPETGKTLTTEETKYNQDLEDLTKELGDKGIIAEPADLARVMKTYGKREIPQAFADLNQQRERMMQFIATLPQEQQNQARQQLEQISSKMLELTNAESGILSDGDNTLEEFFNEDVSVDRGKAINRHLQNGSAVGALQEVIEAKVENMPVEKQNKWKEFMKNILSKGPIVGGVFGILMMFLVFQSMQKQQ